MLARITGIRIDSDAMVASEWLKTIPEAFRSEISHQVSALDRLPQSNLECAVANRWMPKPIWAEKGLTDSATCAWEQIQTRLAVADEKSTFCIYIHTPFCASRCGYCDCYAFALRQNVEKTANHYTQALLAEILCWSKNLKLAKRPISTVHFGGGTPLMLGAENLSRICVALHEHFNINTQTEFALETTSSALSESVFESLYENGFTRLHIGVQSLQAEVRLQIGRREPPESVLAKIRQARNLGWIVSTDTIIGLPGYNGAQICADIAQLIQAGTEGFSVYELVASRRNRPFFVENNLIDQPVFDKYLDYLQTFAYLKACGFKKNLYNHLSIGRDHNRYFCSAHYGDDLLGIGTIADGYFGDYHFLHDGYMPYTGSVSETFPGLCGGIRCDSRAITEQTLDREIRSGNPDPLVFVRELGEANAQQLFERWFYYEFLEIENAENCTLSASGAWFIGAMRRDICAILEKKAYN